MGLKRRIVMVLLLAVCMVVSTGQVSLAKRAIKTDVSLKGMITSDSAIELSWNAYPGASFYLVYRAPVYDGIRFGRYKHIGTAYGNSYVDGNVSRDNTYRYLLRFGVGKTSYKSKVKDVHVGIEAPRFLMAREGGDEFSSTDYNRITLVAAPGAGTIPDGILLQKKVDGKFKKIDAKDYGDDAAKDGYKLEFVDRDVNAGESYQYRIAAYKGKDESGTRSGYTYINMKALNQVGRYKVCWTPLRGLEQENTVALRVDSQKYNYGLVLNKHNRCQVTLGMDKSGQGETTEARVSHYSADGKTWTKAPAGFTIKGGTTYLALTGKNVGTDTVGELKIPGSYSGKAAAISVMNQLKLFYLYSDANVEFYGNKDNRK